MANHPPPVATSFPSPLRLTAQALTGKRAASLATRHAFAIQLLACLVLCFGGGARSSAAGEVASEVIRVACVGDSITQGVHVRSEDNYPSVLGRLLGARYQVRNFGYLGGTVMNTNDRPYSATSEFRKATNYNPNIVVFMLGTNDSKPGDWKHKQRFEADLLALLERFAALPARPRTWVCTPAWVAKHYPGGHDEKIIAGDIIPLIREVAAEKNLPLIDIHAAFEGKPELFADGVHPNVAGCKVLAEEVHGALVSGKAASAPPTRVAVPETWGFGPFVKYPQPVLSPNPASKFTCPVLGKEVRWEEQNVYNPAAVVRDGKVYLFYRADDRNPALKWGRTCRIGMAWSEDGTNFTRHPTPVVFPDNDEWKKYEWEGGCEDLHIVEGEDGTYYMNYTTWSGKGDTLSIATSRDLVRWQKHGPAFRKAEPDKIPGSRSGVVVSRLVGDRLVAAKVNGKYWMYYTHPCALAWSDNLIDWTPTGKAIWPGGGREAGAIALLRDDGILLMTQGGHHALGAWVVRQALIDRNDLKTVRKEQKEPLLWPEYDWEKKGFTGDTTVANTLVPFKGKWWLYYGGADRVTGLAVCPVSQ